MSGLSIKKFLSQRKRPCLSFTLVGKTPFPSGLPLTNNETSPLSLTLIRPWPRSSRKSSKSPTKKPLSPRNRVRVIWKVSEKLPHESCPHGNGDQRLHCWYRHSQKPTLKNLLCLCAKCQQRMIRSCTAFVGIISDRHSLLLAVGRFHSGVHVNHKTV